MSAASFSLMALLLIGMAGCLAAAKLFRWDAQERFVDRSGKGWIGVALVAWVAVGVMAETTNRITVANFDASVDPRLLTALTDSLAAPDSLLTNGITPAPDTAFSEAGDTISIDVVVQDGSIDTVETDARRPPLLPKCRKSSKLRTFTE